MKERRRKARETGGRGWTDAPSLFGPVARPGCPTPARAHTPWLTELMLKSGTRSAGIAARLK